VWDHCLEAIILCKSNSSHGCQFAKVLVLGIGMVMIEAELTQQLVHIKQA